jgi:hypothetical protein
MKFLALTYGEEGLLFDANNWNEAKETLKHNLNLNGLNQEFKLISLKDNIIKHYLLVSNNKRKQK